VRSVPSNPVVLFRNPGFDYSATNINRRGAEFTRDVEFALSPALETPMRPAGGSHVTDEKQHLSTLKISFPWKQIAHFLLSNKRLRSFVLRELCASAVVRSLASGLLPNGCGLPTTIEPAKFRENAQRAQAFL